MSVSANMMDGRGKRRDEDKKEDQSFRDLLGIVQHVLTPFIRQWHNSYQHVDQKVLVVTLTTAVLQFGT